MVFENLPPSWSSGTPRSGASLHNLFEKNKGKGPPISSYRPSWAGGTETLFAPPAGSPSPPVGEDEFLNAADTRGLYNQLQGQKEEARFLGAEPKEEGPSLLARIFDILSRGQYASANVTRNELKKREEEGVGGISGLLTSMASPIQAAVEATLGRAFKGDFSGIEAAGRGLAGKDKTSYGDILEEQNVPSGPGIDVNIGPVEGRLDARGVAGLGLDIGLDPTTYFGGGIAKAAGKEAIEAAGIKALQSAAKRPQNIARAIRTSNKVANPARKAEFNRAIQQIASDAARQAREKAVEEGAGKISLRFLGQEIVSSKRLYRAFSKIGERARNTATGNALYRGFKTTAEFPGRINFLRRTFEGRGVANFDNWATEWRQLTKDFSKEEMRQVSHAIENGIDLHGIVNEAGKDLGSLQDQVKSIFDDLWEVEQELGLHSGKDKLENYIYHTYKTSDEHKVKSFKKTRKVQAVGTEKFGPEQLRTVATLEEAKKAGLKPIEEIDELVARRVAKHQILRSRFDFVKSLEREYGLESSSKLTPKFLQKEGFRKPTSRFVEPDQFFPEPVARVLDGIDELFEHDDAAEFFLKNLNKIQNHWKTFATVYNPGHHLRNTLGDVYLNYLDGVINPLRYKQSARILSAVRKTGGKFSKIKLGGTKNNKILEETLGNNWNVLKIQQLYDDYGLKSGFFRSEFGMEGFGLRGVTEKARKLAELREDWARMAHFTDTLDKELRKRTLKKGKVLLQLDEAAEIAAKKVRKFNLDYGDFTHFEQKYIKKVIPFYSWLRKNLPLQVESLFMKPGRVVALQKGQRAIERMLGTDKNTEYIEDTIPRWIKDLSPIQITGGEEPAFLSLGLPVQDLAIFEPLLKGDVGGSAQELASVTSPFLQIPFELATGTKVFSGAPVSGYGKYASEITPITRLIQRAAATKRGQRDPELFRQDVLNWLFNLGYQKATEERKRGEIRRQQDPVQSLIREARRQFGTEELGRAP